VNQHYDKKVIAILPAYNAERTLKRTFDDIPKEWVSDIILVDDASNDRTVEVSRALGIKTFVHKKNLGYGGNQKTCYRKALEEDADIVVMVHPDHQYDPKAIPELIKPLLNEMADAVFGSRMIAKKNALAGGMPYWKFAANIILTKIENFILRLRLTEYHSGFRAYSRKVLQTVPFEKNSDDFVFDTEIIVQMKIGGFRIEEIPIETHYFPEASMIGFQRSVRYGLGIMETLWKYLIYQCGLKKYAEFDIPKR
jgi:glycosyltransferase involved in cell wall biosynthesis